MNDVLFWIIVGAVLYLLIASIVTWGFRTAAKHNERKYKYYDRD